MSRTSIITRKSALVAIALGLSGLASTSMPAAAGFSQFITPQVFPHQGGPAASQVVGSVIQKPQVPTPVTSGAASLKPGSGIQKGPVPVSGSASSSPYISQTIGSAQITKVPMPSAPTPLPPQPPIPHCEAMPHGCQPYPPAPSTGPNVSINIGRPPVVYGSAPVAMAQAPMMAQQPVMIPRQPAAVQSQPVAAAAPAAAEPASCLSKQYLNDGSALFRDNCTGEAAIATPAQLAAQAQARAAQLQGQTAVQAPVQPATN